MLSKALLSAALASAATAASSSTTTTSSVVGIHLPDPKAPKITDLRYGPNVVSTGSVFSVSLTASDPLGVDSVTFSTYPHQGWWYPCPESKQFTLVNGTAFEGTWKIECPIQEGTPAQTYAFNYNVVDAGKHSSFDTFKNGFSVSGGPAAEYTAPAIAKASTAETVNAGSNLDVYLTVSDVSGIETSKSYVNVHEQDGNFRPCASNGIVLESGSSTDGIFKASCLLPVGTPNGKYWLEVHVYDTQHNPAELRVDNAFEVVNGATPDHSVPSVTNIAYANDTVERGQRLSLSATVSDLGVGQSGIDYVNFEAREYYTQELLCKGPMVQKSGDMTSGVWSFSCDVPVDASIDYYTGAVYAFDNQNNEGANDKGFSITMPTTTTKN